MTASRKGVFEHINVSKNRCPDFGMWIFEVSQYSQRMHDQKINLLQWDRWHYLINVTSNMTNFTCSMEFYYICF